jgi:hypothetical protein
MASYPIIEQRSLAKAAKTGPWGLGGRNRPSSELPLPNAHEVVVYKSGGRYVVDDGRSRTSDDHIANDTNFTVVDMRTDAPVTVDLTIPSAGGAEFNVQVTFLCTVRQPAEVVDAGLRDMTHPLTEYVSMHQALFHVGEDYNFDRINAVRLNVTAEIRAYVSVKPPRFRGIEVKLGNVRVLTPEEFADFHSKLRERERASLLTAEQQRMDHRVLAEHQRMEQQLAKEREELEEIRMRFQEQSELQHRRHAQLMEEMQQKYDQMLRSAKLEHAVDEARKLGEAIDADQHEVPALLAAASGDRTIAETADLLGTERRRRRDEEAAEDLRRRTWAREDAQYERDRAREDARLRDTLRVDELKAQLSVLKAGVDRGLADHQPIEKLLGVVNGAIKALESAVSTEPPGPRRVASEQVPTDGPTAEQEPGERVPGQEETAGPDGVGMAASDDGQRVDQTVVDAEIVPDDASYPDDSFPGDDDAGHRFREEDLGR